MLEFLAAHVINGWPLLVLAVLLTAVYLDRTRERHYAKACTARTPRKIRVPGRPVVALRHADRTHKLYVI